MLPQSRKNKTAFLGIVSCCWLLLLSGCYNWKEPLYADHPAPASIVKLLDGAWTAGNKENATFNFVLINTQHMKITTNISDEIASHFMHVGFVATKYHDRLYLNIANKGLYEVIAQDLDDSALKSKSARGISSRLGYHSYVLKFINPDHIRLFKLDSDVILRLKQNPKVKIIHDKAALTYDKESYISELDEGSEIIDLSGLTLAERDAINIGADEKQVVADLYRLKAARR